MSGLEDETSDETAWAVRRFIYAVLVDRGTPPSVAETAQGLGLAADAARAAFLRLHELHAVFLEPDADRIAVRMAHPFSAAPTSFRVRAGGVEYWANCAWDALGIPAALKMDAAIEAVYADDDGPAAIAITDGQVVGSGVVHFLVPFRRLYDDLIFT